MALKFLIQDKKKNCIATLPFHLVDIFLFDRDLLHPSIPSCAFKFSASDDKSVGAENVCVFVKGGGVIINRPDRFKIVK